ncbi:MAG: hypothetical protein GY940_08810 [bacterium]|nr:hypothetical protein [bacterium]
MEYPMRVYGFNIFERFLVNLLTLVSWLLFFFAVAVIIWKDAFFENVVFGTVLIVCTFFTSLMLGMAGAGLRQNIIDFAWGTFLLLLLGIGWIINGFIVTPKKIGPIIAGAVMLLFLLIFRVLRRQGLRTRFNPRFFGLRQFQTMIQLADTMIETNGRRVVSPIQVAINTDHLLARVDSPVTKTMKLVMFMVEWILPILIFRPFPFSMLGSHERRRAVSKVIHAKGLFRSVAKALKLLAFSGYYGDPRGMAQTGFIPFDDRKRAQGADQSLHTYPDPNKED